MKIASPPPPRRRGTLPDDRLPLFKAMLCVATLIAGIVFVSPATLSAQDGKNLKISLTAERVIQSANGAEELSDSPVAAPGDVIRYTALFQNDGAQTLRRFAPTIPIPAGMVYTPVAALAAPAEASLDGNTFEPIPIRREHRLHNGSKAWIEVPLSSYRALRWKAGELAPGARFTATARVRVLTTIEQP